MADFLTAEDVNSVFANYYDVPFWDSIQIDTDDDISNFTNIKFDYLQVDRTYTNGKYVFSIQVDNSIWQGKCYFLDEKDWYVSDVTYANNIITVTANTPKIYANFYLAVNEDIFDFSIVDWIITSITPPFKQYEQFTGVITLESVNPSFDVNNKEFLINVYGVRGVYVNCVDNKLNINQYTTDGIFSITYNDFSYIIRLHRFKEKILLFPGAEYLELGKINDVLLSSDLQLSPSLADLFKITSNYPISEIRIVQGTLRFNIDLRNADTDFVEIKIELNTIYQYADTVLKIPARVPTITTFDELTSLFSNGGEAILGANITITNDLVVANDVLLIGEGHTLGLNNHNITVNPSTSFKVDNLRFYRGESTIIQKTNSNVELTNCRFRYCSTKTDYPYGSVISCDIDYNSLTVEDDFTTILDNCMIKDCYPNMVLHGGNLQVSNCDISLDTDGYLDYLEDYPNYITPYFLYMNDGNANLVNNTFKVITSYDYLFDFDLKFAPAIFYCGENATINNYNKEDLTRNNFNEFLTASKNTSQIHLEYDYPLIQNFIVLDSDNGFCHCVNGVDYLFKTNVIPVKR